jgi:hypothetical protein
MLDTLVVGCQTEYTFDPATRSVFHRIHVAETGQALLVFALLDGDAVSRLYEVSSDKSCIGAFSSDTTFTLAPGNDYILNVRGIPGCRYSLLFAEEDVLPIVDLTIQTESTFFVAPGKPLQVRFLCVPDRDYLVRVIGAGDECELTLRSIDEPAEVLVSGRDSIVWRGRAGVTGCLLEVYPGEVNTDSARVLVRVLPPSGLHQDEGGTEDDPGLSVMAPE